MSLLPAFSDDFFWPRRWSHDMDVLSSPRSWSYPSNYFTGYHRRPRMLDHLRDTMNTELGKITIGEDGFQVCLDVHQFAPNEINVKTIDNTIVVEAKHEERKDEHGYISRQFTRRYDLPQGFDNKDVGTQLSSDGILTIKAPPDTMALGDGKNVRMLQIQHTGPARLCVGNKDSGKGNEKVADAAENGSQ